MRIGELANRTSVSRDTIRFYERHGLIRSVPGDGATNTYRDYPEDAIFTLEVIQDAQAAGLSIADITVLVGQFLSEAPEAGEGDDFLTRKIAEVEARLAAGQRFLDMLRQTQTALERAPQDGLDEMSGRTGAGNGNRTRN